MAELIQDIGCHNWPSCKLSVCVLTPNTSRMQFRASRSIPGALGLTVMLETTDWIQDTEVCKGHWVISVEVRDIYLPDEGGEETVIWASKGVSWMRDSSTEMTVLKMTSGKII